MRIIDLFEAPIEDFTTLGDWNKSSSFRHEIDRKILTTPSMVEKIKSQWNKTPVPFNLYFVNSPEGNKHTEVGMVTPEWLAENMPKTLPQLNIRPDAVNILFTNNKGAERIPMTGWMIAHRFGHAVSRYGFGKRQFLDFTDARQELMRTVSTILTDGYGRQITDREDNYKSLMVNDKLLVAFYSNIGTMQSARMGKLRNEFEFTLELLAQYMLTGEIKFNPLPKTIVKGKKIYARFIANEHDYEYYNNYLEDLEQSLQDHFDNLLHRCVGKILVM